MNGRESIEESSTEHPMWVIPFWVVLLVMIAFVLGVMVGLGLAVLAAVGSLGVD
jgi:hypothetical protein